MGQTVKDRITFDLSASPTRLEAGTLSIAKAADSPNTDIAVSATNVLMARFEVRAAGEDVKVEAVTVDVDQTAAGGMDNGKVFLNGTQIGSTKDVAAGGTEFTFGSSFIARHGQTEIIEIYGDAKETDATNFAAATTVDVGISVARHRGLEFGQHRNS